MSFVDEQNEHRHGNGYDGPISPVMEIIMHNRTVYGSEIFVLPEQIICAFHMSSVLGLRYEGILVG